jgi:hypothetical protein
VRQHNKFKVGKLTFTLPNNKPTDEMFQQWKHEFFSMPGTKNYNVWLTGGYLEDCETTDIDLILTGKPNYKEVRNLLHQARIIGVKYGLLIDISHWDTEPLYIYENYPSAWGVGSGVEKFVVEKLNIDFRLFINDKLAKEITGYEKVIEGLYRYKFTYPTKKQLTRDYKSKPILLNG